ncbi:hypothetical protein KC356_g343 [Hortaea werneckii]|nr:hypothetical protein KC356_g343 [Hortaea werneckii]
MVRLALTISFNATSKRWQEIPFVPRGVDGIRGFGPAYRNLMSCTCTVTASVGLGPCEIFKLARGRWPCRAGVSCSGIRFWTLQRTTSSVKLKDSRRGTGFCNSGSDYTSTAVAASPWYRVCATAMGRVVHEMQSQRSWQATRRPNITSDNERAKCGLQAFGK